jgi:thioredoxin-related protein
MMKKTLLTLLFLSISLFADVKFKKYDDALKEAQKDNKLIALTVVSTNCPWCHKLLKETLKDKTVESIINKDFVYVLINKDTTPLPSGITAPMVPVTFFLDKTGQKLTSKPTVGFWEAEDFVSYMNDALKKAKKL